MSLSRILFVGGLTALLVALALAYFLIVLPTAHRLHSHPRARVEAIKQAFAVGQALIMYTHDAGGLIPRFESLPYDDAFVRWVYLNENGSTLKALQGPALFQVPNEVVGLPLDELPDDIVILKVVKPVEDRWLVTVNARGVVYVSTVVNAGWQ